jgi:hypothetical protein
MMVFEEHLPERAALGVQATTPPKEREEEGPGTHFVCTTFGRSSVQGVMH